MPIKQINTNIIKGQLAVEIKWTKCIYYLGQLLIKYLLLSLSIIKLYQLCREKNCLNKYYYKNSSYFPKFCSVKSHN